ncbi:MAG: SAM-dependent methyltransferase [Muribaculaceae bacterium]|nr:SAM-dependent methyltransferase [Muribaculaceae bacterium]
MSDGPVTDVLPELNLKLLLKVKYFVVENIRSARRFLRRAHHDIDIDALHFTELNEHTAPGDVPAMLTPALHGHDIGVLSEAGCPAVADPGALLVDHARRHGLRVIPLVGPNSIIMALMASGFNGQSFTFHGYLPIEAGARTAALKEMERAAQHRGQTQIFIEAPYRNARLMQALCRTLSPSTMLCVASDITGPAESIVTLPVQAWLKKLSASPDVIGKVPSIFLFNRQQ